MRTRTWWHERRRWGIVAAVVVALLGLGQVSLDETRRPPRLGLRVAEQGGALVVTWVQPAGLAWDDGVRPGDVVVALAGRPVTVGEGAAVERAPVVQVRKANGAAITASVAGAASVSAGRRLNFLLLAAWFIVVGGSVFVVATDRLAAGVLLGLATAWAVALLAAIATPFGQTWALGAVAVGLLGGGASTFLLFLVFPRNLLRIRLGRGLAVVCLEVHAVLLALYGWIVAVASGRYAILQPVQYAVVLVDLVGAMVLALAAWRAAEPGRHAARRALALVALSTLVGFLPFCLFVLTPALVGFGAIIPPDSAILSIGLLPAGLGAAILSRQFLGITTVVRRGLVALAVWFVLLATFSLGLDALRQELGVRSRLAASLLGSTTLGVAVIAATFPLLQAWLRRIIEERLFHDVYDYEATLKQLGMEIANLGSLETTATHVLARLGKTLDLRWAALALQPDCSTRLLYRWGACPVRVELLATSTGGSLGAPEHASQAMDGLADVASLVVDGLRIGTLLIGVKRHDVSLSPQDSALVATLAPLVAASLQNALLVRRLEDQVAVLGEREQTLASLNARLIQVQEEERRRIALELHDDPLQRVALLTRDLGTGPRRAVTAHDLQALEEILGSLRAICGGLRPPILDDLGLVAGLEWLVDDMRTRADFELDLAVGGQQRPDARLEPALELALYRVAQEALTNCLKHAEATRVIVSLCWNESRLVLRVADDGRGYESAGGSGSGLGLLGMRERLRPWHGTVTVGGGPSGGTMVTAIIPLRRS